MTESDDIERILFDRHPQVKARNDRQRAMELRRQRVFDAMDLAELREAAVAALTSAAEALMKSSQSSTMLSDDWTAKIECPSGQLPEDGRKH